jgi:vitamin K-dependent gamma-carboxylase
MNTNLSKKANSSPANKLQQTKMKILFGFDLDDLRTWDNFVKLMNRPEDPSSLGLFRILFGLLMIIDIPNERG